MRLVTLAASAIVALAVSTSASAQGNGNGNGQSKKKSAPPSRNDLASPVAVTSGGGAAPFAWVDDASIIEPGSVSISVSAVSWHGGGTSELDVPIVDAAIGLSRRVQLSANVPATIGGGDPAGAAGGIGTTYFGAKIAVFEQPRRGLKVAVSPTLELLSHGVLDAIGPAEQRAHWGLPVSAEIDRGRLRAYTGGGYFSRGVWFGGAGASYQARNKTFVSGTFSQSWRRDATGLVPIGDRRRTDVSGGVAYVLHPQVVTFGSLGRTINTLEQNGAGTTISGGLSLLLPAHRR